MIRFTGLLPDYCHQILLTSKVWKKKLGIYASFAEPQGASAVYTTSVTEKKFTGRIKLQLLYTSSIWKNNYNYGRKITPLQPAPGCTAFGKKNFETVFFHGTIFWVVGQPHWAPDVIYFSTGSFRALKNAPMWRVCPLLMEVSGPSTLSKHT